MDINAGTGRALGGTTKPGWQINICVLKRERPGAGTPGQFDQRVIASLIREPIVKGSP
ncbi:hypothetical protein [Streptomyces microflavus]|uniref:hypothetical protein n=1 Tax=Streptomyces microflavus TaxID=1919 RepID=UPI002E3339A8|nr:hypothetical protein [Streptomyces microflavus]